MKLPKKTLTILAGTIGLFTVFAIAATLLVQVPVDQCADLDGGVNINQSSSTWTVINGNFRAFDDFCLNNQTLREYTCSNNGTQDFLEIWEETNCTCSNGACI